MELGEFAQGEHKTTRMRVSWVGCPRDHQHVRVVDEKERTIEIGKHPGKGGLEIGRSGALQEKERTIFKT